VEAVEHGARIHVDEKGTEAAASTAVLMSLRCCRQPARAASVPRRSAVPLLRVRRRERERAFRRAMHLALGHGIRRNDAGGSTLEAWPGRPTLSQPRTAPRFARSSPGPLESSS
jgi:hypothetical protein